MMARYGVACPLPHDEEMVRPKMVIFTRFEPFRRRMKRFRSGEMIFLPELLPEKLPPNFLAQ